MLKSVEVWFHNRDQEIKNGKLPKRFKGRWSANTVPTTKKDGDITKFLGKFATRAPSASALWAKEHLNLPADTPIGVRQQARSAGFKAAGPAERAKYEEEARLLKDAMKQEGDIYEYVQ